jgi:hypothetical protein
MGIVVSTSSGNSDHGEFTVVNVAPRILTVGASIINHQFPANNVLGNGDTFPPGAEIGGRQGVSASPRP